MKVQLITLIALLLFAACSSDEDNHVLSLDS